MNRTLKTTAVAATFCAVAGAGIVGYGEVTAEAQTRTQAQAQTQGQMQTTSATTARHGHGHGDSFSGTKKIRVDGYSVNVSCSGHSAARKPVVVLMAGAGDGLDSVAGLQKTLSKKNRVCSYDRLGEGESDQPNGIQTINDSSKILTGVLNQITGDRPVVLAGHSMGGYIAARYAPDHRDKVKGLVLMDATIPALTAGISKAIPESATGLAAEMRAGAIAGNEGQNPEQFVIDDVKVRSAGRIPVQIIKHESEYSQVPDYRPALEQMWSEGQHEWLGLSRRSSLSTAAGSGHYIYRDRPDIAVKAIQGVTAQATARW
ncbi:alpha/beta fold hydrolase [Streptomyces aurantiacus]|uniref:Alpha/beta hydrolase n=1 Tax=Streptomyces aurantiacus TaxID=47760 RepID=A0A7G1P291_9ACTN|nr:alpha/beta hydrolase family protein [Streptomyces aurantiacus]BCL29528.1 alpha/beta hydrolase [Streptomyces aurantiacus]